MGRNKKQRLRGVEALRALQARRSTAGRSVAVGVADKREVSSAPEFEIIERFNGKLGEVWLCKQQGVYFTREAAPMDHCLDESHILDYIGPEGGWAAGAWSCGICNYSFDDECYFIIDMSVDPDTLPECGFCGATMLKTIDKYGMVYWCPYCGGGVSHAL